MGSSKRDLCEKLDKVLLDFFETLSQLYLEQANLGLSMKSGYLNMSRARYNMGIKSVGIAQCDEKTTTASVKVHETEERRFIAYEKETEDESIKSDDFDLKSSEENSGSSVRRRKVTKPSSEVKDEHIEEVTPESHTQNGKIDNDKERGVEKTVDPLRWFGILVPQSLKQSQTDFRKAAYTAISIADLQIKLSTLQDEYRTLLKSKESLQ